MIHIPGDSRELSAAQRQDIHFSSSPCPPGAISHLVLLSLPQPCLLHHAPSLNPSMHENHLESCYNEASLWEGLWWSLRYFTFHKNPGVGADAAGLWPH